MSLLPRAITNFKVAGTKSYRLSAAQLFDLGLNLQNPDEEILCLLQARKGCSFVQPDQSGAESAVVANLAPPGRYLDLLNVGEKPHTLIALHLFATTNPQWFSEILPKEVYLNELIPSELVKLPHWRTLKKRIADSGKPYKVGKMVVHMSSYGGGWKTFMDNALKQSKGALIMTAAEAKTFLEMFHKLFPEIKQWQQEVIFTARKYRELTNMFGYPRRFERIFTSSYEREIISWIPQSTVGCLSTEAIFIVEDYIQQEKKRWNLLNQKHDSILLEVPDSEISEAAKVASDAIKSFVLTGRDGKTFRMKSSICVGRNWGHYDAEHNPNGMKELSI
jgi:hypothetical protein